MSDHTLSPQGLRELAAHAVMPEKTVRRCYRGERCKPATYERLRRAAGHLGFPLPPMPELDPPPSDSGRTKTLTVLEGGKP